MHPYLPHLLDDIAAAKATPPSRPAHLPQPLGDFEAHIEQVEAYLHGPMHDFGYWTGIEWEALPPPEVFTDEEVAVLANALIELWRAYNVWPEFTEGMPEREKYRAMRDCWREETSMIHGASDEGSIVYDFCSGVWQGCPLGDYCACKDFEEDS